MKTNYKKIFMLIIPLIILMIISLLNMYNARLLNSIYLPNLKKQIIWYLLGITLFLVIQKINFSKLLNYSFWAYLFSLFLLFLVLIIGKEINGAKAWFNFKYFSFQPSELMKLTLTLYLAHVISKTKINNLKDEIKLIIKTGLITLIPSILVFLEPDTGAILFFLIILATSLFISKIHKQWFIILGILISIFLGIFIFFYIYNPDFLIDIIGTSFFYRVERIITFQTESSYQLENALTVIGSASFFGTGLGKISLYIPEAPTDFIFAFTIGNFGLFTGFLVLLCYLLIDYYLINSYYNIKSKKIKLFTISFISIFLFQQIINISMNLGLLPIIGIPLPFLSYGGSTILIYFLYLGLFQNLYENDIKQII